mgnify:CR=1 FL=1
MWGSVKYITDSFLNRKYKARAQKGSNGLPSVMKNKLIAETQAHFFASLNFLPVTSARIPRATKTTENVTFSVNVLEFDALRNVSGSASRKADSIHKSIEQYLMPLVGGCLNSFIPSQRTSIVRRAR